jgi:hypothetical protein
VKYFFNHARIFLQLRDMDHGLGSTHHAHFGSRRSSTPLIEAVAAIFTYRHQANGDGE